MNTPRLEDLNAATSKALYISAHYPEFYEYLMNNFPKDLLFGERLYWYYNHISAYPLCSCGQRTKFINSKQGYREFCSYRCMNSSEDVQLRKKKTSIEHYGVDNPMKSKIIKDKNKQTCIEHYGVDNVSKSKIVKDRIKETNILKYGVEAPMQSEQVKLKSKQTCLERYGVEYTGQIPSVVDKKKEIAQTVEFKNNIANSIRNTCLERYGVENPSQHSEFREKAIKTIKENFLKNNPNVIGYTETGMWKMKCCHPECTLCKERWYETNQITRWNREVNNIEQCTRLLPVAQANNRNTSLELFIQNILDENNIAYETNVRNVIPPKELDIYIPSHNIAIECNGIFWHSDKVKENEYHREKYEACKQKGIQLLTIWEDWIVNKRDIVKSIILSKLGIYKERIYARKCEIREVSAKNTNHFLEQNHIQGKCSSQKRYGLYYRDELVSIMTFGKKRKAVMGNHNTKDVIHELIRFCNKQGYQIIGGASKLLKHFIDKVDPNIIESFSSNDISNGNLYKQLGFVEDNTNNSYWYISPEGKRYHRSSFTKDAIVRRGWKKNKEGWTEAEVMLSKGYSKIYDTGQTKWIWTK